LEVEVVSKALQNLGQNKVADTNMRTAQHGMERIGLWSRRALEIVNPHARID
jgi:hypothetical protein